MEYTYSNQDNTKKNNNCSRLSNISYPSRTVVHAKLEMTEPGDHDEQEADAVANTIAVGGKISRKISGGSGSSGITVSNQMESQLNHLQGGGQAMPSGLRSMMESGFGQDFSHVRLHTDSAAASLSSSIHAKAFTHGNDIYFNQGQFSPNTTEGQKLMAHELTHVVQGGGKIGRDYCLFANDGIYGSDSNCSYISNNDPIRRKVVFMIDAALNALDSMKNSSDVYLIRVFNQCFRNEGCGDRETQLANINYVHSQYANLKAAAYAISIVLVNDLICGTEPGEDEGKGMSLLNKPVEAVGCTPGNMPNIIYLEKKLFNSSNFDEYYIPGVIIHEMAHSVNNAIDVQYLDRTRENKPNASWINNADSYMAFATYIVNKNKILLGGNSECSTIEAHPDGMVHPNSSN